MSSQGRHERGWAFQNLRRSQAAHGAFAQGEWAGFGYIQQANSESVVYISIPSSIHCSIVFRFLSTCQLLALCCRSCGGCKHDSKPVFWPQVVYYLGVTNTCNPRERMISTKSTKYTEEIQNILRLSLWGIPMIQKTRWRWRQLGRPW